MTRNASRSCVLPLICQDRFMKSISWLAVFVVGFAFVLGTAKPQERASPAPARFQIPETDDGLPGQGPIRRYDWFRKTWNERRSKFADRAEQDRGAVVMLGDSITQGWGDDFTGWFPGMKIANRGIRGHTSRGAPVRLPGDGSA